MSLDIEPALKIHRIKEKDRETHYIIAALYSSGFEGQFEPVERIDLRRAIAIVLAVVVAAIMWR